MKGDRKIKLFIRNVPELLQLKILDVVSSKFPDLSIEIYSDLSPEENKVVLIFWDGNNSSEFSKFKGNPLFLFVDLNSVEKVSVMEFSEMFPVFDYCVISEPEGAISNRITLFIKRVVEYLESSDTTGKGFLEFVRNSLGKLFSALFSRRSVEVGVDLSPVIGNKWTRVKKLGFGSFGEVWLVQRKGTISGEFAVAKIPHDVKFNPKFIQEAEILKKLGNHPNAVRLIEVINQQNKVIIIEEFVEGDTLQKRLDEGMSSVEKEQIFIQILDMIGYAHELNIMHRDLKPENIIINTRGLVKILDFGTAKDVSRRSISSTVIGSRPYMAPEQILGESRIASDVWALGVILYALTTDYVPFYSENEKELMDMILEAPPEPPSVHAPSISKELEDIILKCLEKDWKKRFPNARSLQKAIFSTFPDFGKGSVIP